MDAIDFEHDLVIEDEFDALTIEAKSSDPLQGAPEKYPGKLHARKVAEKLGAREGLIYLPGQVDGYWEDSDQGPPFRQRRYFYYLTGADFPGCSVTYDIGEDKLTLWIPYTPPARILWFGKTPSAEECLARYDVHEVRRADDELTGYLLSRLPEVGTLYVLRASQLPKLVDGLSLNQTQTQMSGLRIDTETLQPAMDEARVIKTDYEIAMIRKANAVSSEAHRRVAKGLRTMSNECEIEAAFLASCTAQNAHAQAYPIIAGSGANASTLHYDANNEPLEGRQLVVLDAGAEWDCYASDVTRTLPIGGSSFSPEARAIYDIVHQMQEACIRRIRPGVVFRDLHLLASFVAVKGLLNLGILQNGTAEEIYKKGTVALFFPHGLGHHVGLDVHDVQSSRLLRPLSKIESNSNGSKKKQKRQPMSPKGLRQMIMMSYFSSSSSQIFGPRTPDEISAAAGLQRNMVVTVEPGLYFCRPYIESHIQDDNDAVEKKKTDDNNNNNKERTREQEEMLMHRKYVNRDVLERYYPVGGVRIEDCVRVTEEGHENLTTAPKGGELLALMGV